MFLTLDKFRQRVRELGEKRYFGHSCIAPFYIHGGKSSSG